MVVKATTLFSGSESRVRRVRCLYTRCCYVVILYTRVRVQDGTNVYGTGR